MLLVFLVDYCRSGLEACPNLLSQFFCHGASLTILLMQFLQLMEGTDNVALISQFLGSLTKFGLYLKVFLKIILTSLTVKVQQVVELLYIQLIIPPQLVGLLGRNGLNLLPLLLQSLEVLE